MITFVTAFYITKNPCKTVDVYFNQFKKLASTGINIAVYISPEYKNELLDICHVHPNVKLINTVFIENSMIYECVERKNPKIAFNGNVQKDTKEYMIIQNTKIECIKDAIDKNVFNTEYFSWIDFGLFHVIKHIESSDLLRKIASSQFKKDNIIIPGCWNKGYSYTNGICWRFCGGFFIGHKNACIDMYNKYKTFLPIFLEKYNLLTWEVNIWAAMEHETSWNPDWYLADHNDSIINIPKCYYL